MRIGFFGGSFDPPHLGHLAVAENAKQEFALDAVLFVPTGNQPLKPGGSVAPFEDRLQMVSLLCACDTSCTSPSFVASSLDAPLPSGEPNFTVNTLKRLRGELTSKDVIFVIVGADAFLDLRRWASPDVLLLMAEWIVVSRPGFSLRAIDALGLNAEQLRHVHLLSGVQEEASASLIRMILARGGDCVGLLPSTIVAYIRGRHLYGT